MTHSIEPPVVGLHANYGESEMDGDAAWLAARFDELSKRYPVLSLVVVMRPDDIDRVPHEAPDEHSVYSVVGGKYQWQCFAPDPVVVRDFEKDGEEFEVVSLPKPWLSFPFWHYSRGGETWKHGIWEMWLHRRFSFDPRIDDSGQELTGNIECLNAYCSLLEAATSLLLMNPSTREQWFFKDYCMPYPWENRKFESAGPWLLFLAECYPGQEVLYSPVVRVIHDIGVTSVRVLREMMRVENASPQQKLPESDASRPEDGLHDENRRLVWGGVSFTLTTNQAMVFQLLVEAYPSDVLLSRFEDIGIGALRDSFRRKNIQGKHEYDPVWYLVDRGTRKDSKRMLDPAKLKTDPRFISASPT